MAEGQRRSLSDFERVLIERMRRGERVARDITSEREQSLTFGQRLADELAAWAGSWTFILCFFLFLAAWVVLNETGLVGAWDIYPFILLNLMLSMLAAIQAPVIMMSQNRSEARDRLQARNDFEVNLKAELEIQDLHRKLDELRERHAEDMQTIQHQWTLLEGMLTELKKS